MKVPKQLAKGHVNYTKCETEIEGKNLPVICDENFLLFGENKNRSRNWMFVEGLF